MAQGSKGFGFSLGLAFGAKELGPAWDQCPKLVSMGLV